MGVMEQIQEMRAAFHADSGFTNLALLRLMLFSLALGAIAAFVYPTVGAAIIVAAGVLFAVRIYRVVTNSDKKPEVEPPFEIKVE